MVDVFSAKKRSEIMSKVRNKNTDIELILRKSLWNAGYRYRLHYKAAGSPDIALVKYKVAVFCDGDFWHGCKFEQEKRTYKRFWREKIQRNIKRDKYVVGVLRRSGWKVLRFWKSGILKDPNKCVKRIIKNVSG